MICFGYIKAERYSSISLPLHLEGLGVLERLFGIKRGFVEDVVHILLGDAGA